MSILVHKLDKKRGYVLNELNRLERVTRFSRIFGNASTLEDVCRSIVQADEFSGKLVGTQIHTLTRRGTFVSAALFLLLCLEWNLTQRLKPYGFLMNTRSVNRSAKRGNYQTPPC
jgi:hypothetical protein